ncbi:MAG: hypothetical protein FWF97_00390 [Alphaproteobacteria bacterium]|nr:hypothetical protein [Alphaproteobacteria bacterium]
MSSFRILNVTRTFEMNNPGAGRHGGPDPEYPLNQIHCTDYADEFPYDHRGRSSTANAASFDKAEILGYFNIEAKGDDFFTLTRQNSKKHQM